MQAWDQVPTFDDPNANVKLRTHEPSGAEVAEVWYTVTLDGGEEPVPVEEVAEGVVAEAVEAAKEAAVVTEEVAAAADEAAPTSEGEAEAVAAPTTAKGHLLAVKLGDQYVAASWKHPKADGTVEEYTDTELGHDLKGLERTLRERRAIIDAAYDAASAKPYDEAAYQELVARWDALPAWQTPRGEQLDSRWQGAQERNARAKANQDRLGASREAKEALIAEAASLKDSTDWRATSDRMAELMASWKEAGFSGEDVNDALWEKFRGIRKEFYDRREQHYSEQRERHATAKATKEALVEEAKKVLAEVTNWKQSTDLMNDVYARWRQAGSAGRDEDDRLWDEFNAVRNEFYEGKRAFNLEREARLQESAQKKRALIEEAQGFADARDFGREATDRMKALSGEWKEAGFSGRENDELWTAFRAAQDAFWDAKKSAAADRHEQWRERTQGAVDRRRARLERLRANVERNKQRLATATVMDPIDQIEDWIAEDEELIAQLEAEVQKMVDELGDEAK